MIQNLLKSIKDSVSKLPTKQQLRMPIKVTSHLNNLKNDLKKSLKKDEDLLIEKPNDNDKKLMLFNSFTKIKQSATVNGEQIFLTNNANTNRLQLAKAYICGPTVYDESHIGHAITYLRFDLIRRILKRYCAVDLGMCAVTSM